MWHPHHKKQKDFEIISFDSKPRKQSLDAEYITDQGKIEMEVFFKETESGTYFIQLTLPSIDSSLKSFYNTLHRAGFFNYPTFTSIALQQRIPLITVQPAILATFIRIATECYPILNDLHIISPLALQLNPCSMPKHFQQYYRVNSTITYLSYAFHRSLLTRIVISPERLQSTMNDNVVYSTHINGHLFLCLEFAAETKESFCDRILKFFTCGDTNPISQCHSALCLDAVTNSEENNKNSTLFKEHLERKLTIVRNYFPEIQLIFDQFIIDACEWMPNAPIIKGQIFSDDEANAARIESELKKFGL